MKGISKNTTIILIIVLIFGIVFGATFGFLSGKKIVNEKNKKSEISNKVSNITEETKKQEEDKIIEVVATSDLEFVTDIKNTSEKFASGECNIYKITYNNIVYTVTGKTFIGIDGYNVKNITISFNGNTISKDMVYGDVDFGYSRNIDANFISDGTNTLYTIISNISNDSNQPSSYIISFNQNGDVILNEENKNYNYYLNSSVENNIEVKSIVSIYALGNYVYGGDSINVCSENYLNMIKDYADDTIVYSKKIYTYSNNTLNISSEENRTIAEDKVQKAC